MSNEDLKKLINNIEEYNDRIHDICINYIPYYFIYENGKIEEKMIGVVPKYDK